MRTALATVLFLLAALPACESAPRRTPPRFAAGETEDEIRARMGKPDRVIAVEDPAGGPPRTVWFYDEPADVAGGERVARGKVVTRLDFEDGRLRKVAEIPVSGEPDEAVYPGAPGFPRDSTYHRGSE